MTTPVAPDGLHVHPRLRKIELRRAWLLGLSGALLIGGLAAFALWRAWVGVDAAWRYEHGVPAASARVTRISIKRGLIVQVSGNVAYTDARGAAHVHELRVLRVLANPEPRDPIDVRYAADEPSDSVSSWEHESLLHELAVALVCALLSALFTGGLVREVRGALARVALTAELAKNGQLLVVELLESKRDDAGFRVMFHYRYCTPSGAVLESSIASSEGGAYRVAETDHQSLALVSHDGRRGVLLTRSGYPLLNAAEALADRRAHPRE